MLSTRARVPAACVPPCVVLLVDDDTDTRTIYGRILTSMGYRVIEAEMGSAALALAQATTPDVVVLDLGLPDMDGLNVARALRADRRTFAIPIAVLTAYVSSADRTEALAAGCDLYLAKPLLPRALAEAVEALRASRAASPPVEAPPATALAHDLSRPGPQPAV